MKLSRRLAALEEAAGPDSRDLREAVNDLKCDGTLPENDVQLRNLVISISRSLYLLNLCVRPEGWQPTEVETAADQICDCLARCVDDPAARVELRRLMAVRTLHGYLRGVKAVTASDQEPAAGMPRPSA